MSHIVLTLEPQTTVVQMLLGLINLGSSSAFLAFVSVGVISLAVSYGIPIAISLFHRRRDVNGARWTMGRTVGWVVNIIALLWIIFEMVLFSMPTVLPVTEVSMNYAIVVFFGFMAISAAWYAIHARKGKPTISRRQDALISFDFANTTFSSLQGSAGVRWPRRYFLKYSAYTSQPWDPSPFHKALSTLGSVPLSSHGTLCMVLCM